MPAVNKKTLDISSAVQQVRKGLEVKQREAQAIITRMEEIERAKEALRTAPLNLNDWGRYLKAHIDSMGQSFGAVHMSVILRKRTGEPPQNELGWGNFESENGSITFPVADLDRLFSPEQMFRALCLMFPDELHRVFMERFTARHGERWGNHDAIPVDERRKMVQTLDAELTLLREQKEALTAEIHEITKLVAA